MSRKKGKSKAKGGGKSTPHRVTSTRRAFQSRPVQEATVPKFSLVDEAHWMANHRTTAFDATKKLRELPIQFVSAGYLEGTIKERPPATAAETASVQSEDEPVAASSPSTSTPSLNNTLAMAEMAIRSPSPSLSEASSSADEVIFRGRGQIAPAPVATSNSLPASGNTAHFARPVTAVASTSASPPPSLQVPEATTTASSTLKHETATLDTPQLTAASTDDHTSVNAEVEAQISVHVRLASAPSTDQEANLDSDADSVVDEGFQKRRGGRPVWEGTTTPWVHRSIPGIGWLPRHQRPDMEAFIRGDVNPRDAAMDDYIQNMDDYGLADHMHAASAFSRREMDLDGGNHNDWQPTSSNEGEEEQEDSGNDSWNSAMLKDFDDLSTSSDVMDDIVRILSKRTSESGVAYLCVYEGSVTDDARWLPSVFLTRATDQRLIQAFEDRLRLRDHHQLDGSNDDSDEELGEIDDETMARRLQKQEEFGMGSEELLLHTTDDIFIAPAGASASFDFGRPNKRRQARVRGRNDYSFPSASAMADAVAMDPYGGFDVMDTERPSLKAKKKGRRGQLPPELEDAELNEQLQIAWENDRTKKRLKKAEREELRKQGLLGKKGKYYGILAIALEEVVDNIREFLLSEKTTLPLPPMEARHRATIHGLANQLGLSSKSQGSEQDRFIVLSRTRRTGTWTDDEFNRTLKRRNFAKRLRGSKESGHNVKGAAVGPKYSYKDGETVGANAPELGPENKGHALMERMGWSKGMALGASDNKGILQPIPHMVKTNRAGLQ